MPRELNLREKHQVIQSLWTAVNDGGTALEHVPHIVKTVLLTEAWKERQDGKETYTHETFRRFIEAPPRAGCGWPLDKVRSLLKSHPDVERMYDKAIAPGQGFRSDLVHNVNEVARSKGNSRAYALDRLSRQAPGLYDAVCRGEISANRAAIEAGFRKPPKPFDQIRRLLSKLTDEERQKLRSML